MQSLNNIYQKTKLVLRKEWEQLRDGIFTLRMIIERSQEVNAKIYTCFIDYQKAFDRVKHNKLMEVLENVGIGYARFSAAAIDRNLTYTGKEMFSFV